MEHPSEMIHKLAYLYVFSIFVYGFDGPIEKRMGPVFISEPPSSVDFLNTTGVAVDCLAFGSPSPRISWRKIDICPCLIDINHA